MVKVAGSTPAGGAQGFHHNSQKGHTMSARQLLSIDDIKQAANESSGYHKFFSPGSNQFFDAQYEEKVYPCAFMSGAVFISSEQDHARTDPRDRVRGWTIRHAYFDEDGDFQLGKLSEVQGVESAEEAHRFARVAASAHSPEHVQELWRAMLDEDEEPLPVLLGQLRLVVTERQISRTAGDPRFWSARIERAVPGSWVRVSEESTDIDFEGPHDVDLAGEYDEPRDLLWGRGRRLQALPIDLNGAWKTAMETRDRGASKAPRVESIEQLRTVLDEIEFKDHEPDEADVSAQIEVRGVRLDNAGFWPQRPELPFTDSITEFHLVLQKDGKPAATVNISTLLGWITQEGDNK